MREWLKDLVKKVDLFKKVKTTAPGIPVWSPTTVLTEPSPALFRRSDGMRCVLVCMAVVVVLGR